jgi:exodeoxyribonuclease-3
MKIASFNVNSIRPRLNIVMDWLKKESPDVLCLQETKVPDESFPKEAFEEINYHSAYRGEKSYNGIAVLSKSRIEKVKVGFDDNESDGTRVITAAVNNIPIVNTYVPQGVSPLSDKFREKLDWLQRLLDYFKQHFMPDSPLIWLGDFNIAPEPADVYDPEFLSGQVCFHPDEHAVLRKIREWGFVDVFRLHHPQPGQYTFWDYQVRNAVKRKIGWRLDHIWATAPLSRKSTRCWIDIGPRLLERPSDHTFIIAEFEI